MLASREMLVGCGLDFPTSEKGCTEFTVMRRVGIFRAGGVRGRLFECGYRLPVREEDLEAAGSDRR
jgi:hypothetical protein